MNGYEFFEATRQRNFENRLAERQQKSYEQNQNRFYEGRAQDRFDRLMEARRREEIEREIAERAKKNRIDEILLQDELTRKRMADSAKLQEDSALNQFNREWGPGGPKAMKLPENQPPKSPADIMKEENAKMKLEQDNRSLKANELAFQEGQNLKDGATIQSSVSELVDIVDGVPGKMKGEGLIKKNEQIAKGGGNIGYGMFNRHDRRKEVGQMSKRAMDIIGQLRSMPAESFNHQQKREIARATAQLDGRDIRGIFEQMGIRDDQQIGSAIVAALRRGEYTPDEAQSMLQKLGLE